MSFPLRNMVRDTKAAGMSFENLREYYYNSHNSLLQILLPGYEYEIKNSCFQWGEIGCGSYIYELKFIKKNIFTNINNKDKDKILLINNYEDLVKFNRKYTKLEKEKEGLGSYLFRKIKYKKLINDYGGIEIRNYNAIRKKLREVEKGKYQSTFFYVLDYDTGRFWDEKLIKEIKYFREVKESDYEE